MKIRMLMDN